MSSGTKVAPEVGFPSRRREHLPVHPEVVQPGGTWAALYTRSLYRDCATSGKPLTPPCKKLSWPAHSACSDSQLEALMLSSCKLSRCFSRSLPMLPKFGASCQDFQKPFTDKRSTCLWVRMMVSRPRESSKTRMTLPTSYRIQVKAGTMKKATRRKIVKSLVSIRES